MYTKLLDDFFHSSCRVYKRLLNHSAKLTSGELSRQIIEEKELFKVHPHNINIVSSMLKAL
jgi:hypothetical protein